MEYLGSIVLDREINRIQGGKVYDGRLYLSHDAKSSTDEMLLSVDIATGRVDVELTRHMPNYDNEAEDVCVYPMPDGSLFHFMDYDKLICATVWHFKKAD